MLRKFDYADDYCSTHSITFMQYNMGSSLGDTLCKYTNDELQATPITEADYLDYAAKRNEGLWRVATKIDVFFLQERLLEPVNVALVDGLKERGFEIFHAADMKRPDCLIAIRKGLFEIAASDQSISIKETLFETETPVAKNHSFFDRARGTDFAIIRAEHKPTGLPLTLASAHIEAFTLDAPKESIAYAAKNGDDQTHSLVNTHLKDVSDLTIVGCDLNSQRDVYAGRHEILTQAGYAEYKTDEETALFKQSTVTPKRWLDYFFVRNLSPNNFFQKIKNLFFSSITTEFTLNQPSSQFKGDWDWCDMTKNSSDHMPIIGTLQITKQNSKLHNASVAISRMIQYIKSLWPFFTKP